MLNLLDLARGMAIVSIGEDKRSINEPARRVRPGAQRPPGAYTSSRIQIGHPAVSTHAVILDLTLIKKLDQRRP
jgi:hypothetical protein